MPKARAPGPSELPPVVLALSGLDPTGSAGLLADVRVIGALGCHPCGIVTCETVQSSRGMTGVRPADPELLGEQLRAVMDDLIFRAVKIGALASVQSIEVIGAALSSIPGVPVVLDPVFAPTVGPRFLDMDGMRAMSREILGRTLIATPNIGELGAPAGLDVDQSDDEMILGCAGGWFGAGVQALLVTGLRREGAMVDRLIRRGAEGEITVIDIRHAYHDVGDVHGGGCVLAAALAAHIARGGELEDAARSASHFASGLIERARRFGVGAAFWIDAGGR
jgi:hydroxymethylpyrimidine/phosphomethylpyrimidine kinase